MIGSSAILEAIRSQPAHMGQAECKSNPAAKNAQPLVCALNCELPAAEEKRLQNECKEDAEGLVLCLN